MISRALREFAVSRVRARRVLPALHLLIATCLPPVGANVAMGSVAAVGERPANVIVADALGWADLAIYGGPFIDTPPLDDVTRKGVRFSQACASPVCAPSRAAMQAGLHGARLRMTDVLNGRRRPWEAFVQPEHRWQLPSAAATLAESLSPAGYSSGIVGRWHLGLRPGDPSANQGYLPVPDDLLEGPGAAELEAWIATIPEKAVGSQLRQSVRFIERKRAGPFLCIVSFHTAQTPMEAPDEGVPLGLPCNQPPGRLNPFHS